MKAKVIQKKDLGAWVDSLISKHNLIGAREKEAGKFEFKKLGSAAELVLDYDVTVTPPKAFFLPPKETLLKFTTSPKVTVTPVIESNESVLFGVHPYDMIAISQMDRLFEEDNRDTNYLDKRAKSVVVGIDPTKATKWSFWAAMNAAKPSKGYDLWLTDLGDRYFVEVASEKGEKLLSGAKTAEAGAADEAARQAARDKMLKLCSDRDVKANTSELPELFKRNYENHIWEKRAEKCYSCGSCNLVCPTCYCFDVREDLNLDLKGGSRTRYWDGCLLEAFAHVGSGENFREERSQRYRHRLFRKMTYMMDKIGELACVGCGRCSSVCLPDIADPVKVINELKEGK